MVTLRTKASNHAKASVVNASLAEVPQDARALYDKALQLGKAGDTEKAIENLKGAISLYPKFPLALNELGVQYLTIGQAGKAVEPRLREWAKPAPSWKQRFQWAAQIWARRTSIWAASIGKDTNTSGRLTSFKPISA